MALMLSASEKWEELWKLKVKLESIKKEKLFYELDTRNLEEQIQNLMQTYLVIKREYDLTKESYSTLADRKRDKEKRRQDHLAWCKEQSDEVIEQRIIKAQALARGFLQRKKYRKLLKDMKQRKNLMKEMLETEKSYVLSLKRCIKVYKVPLRYACNSTAPIVREAEIERMFGNMEELYDYHRNWLAKLDERISNLTVHTKIGEIFFELEKALALYQSYGKTHAAAVRMVERLFIRNEEFNNFCRAREGLVLPLPSLLIMPIQRIPRYSLLMNGVIKHTPKHHLDYQSLVDSLEVISKLADGMDSAAKSTNNNRKIMEIENMFSEVCLLDGKRKYVKHDFVGVIFFNKKEKKVRNNCLMCVFSDCLIVGHVSDMVIIDENGREIEEYVLDLNLPIIDINIEHLPEKATDKESTNAFKIKCSNSVYQIFCKRPEEKKMWQEVITKSKNAYVEALMSMNF